MSVPDEPNFASNASYDVRLLSTFHDSMPYPETTTAAGGAAVNMDVEGAEINNGGETGVQARLDQFRDWFSRSCCSCVAKMPAILLVISICLVVAMLLALIPAVFVLTNAVSSDSQALVSLGEDVDGFRQLNALGFDNETEMEEVVKMVPTVHGISVTSLYPPNVTMCYGWGFTCLNEPSIVISTAKRCDGHMDCPDGSDERDCKECQTWASCELADGDLRCLSSEYLCDKINHCVDQYDEKHYCRSDCDEGEHRCKRKNGLDICLPKEAMCDGNYDCADGSDEYGCSVCTTNAKFCKDLDRCIPARLLCNGTPDCDDGSDEIDCDCRSCSGNHRAVCGDGTCIDENRICDGIIDCSDGMDEENCPGMCEISENIPDELEGSGNPFCCKFDNSCHPASARCDGNADCPDGEDEVNCTCDECLGRHRDVYMCGDGSRCLRREDVCSPYSTCPNATFEDKAYCAVQALKNQEDF